jgi:Flp pilus assembly CpaF family ATPase
MSNDTKARVEIVYDDSTEAFILGALGPEVAAFLADEDVTEIFVRRSWVSVERLSSGFESVPKAVGTCNIVSVLLSLAPLQGTNLSLADASVELSLPIGPGIRFTGLYAGPAGRDSLLTLRMARIRRVSLETALDSNGGKGQEILGKLTELLAMPQGGLLIAGGVGTGKTTILRSCADHVIENYGNDEHIVVVEDAEELKLEGPHVTAITSTRWFSYRDALRQGLRHRPTRLIVGEVRGGEAFDAVKAGATAGAGLQMTIHAPTAKGAVRALIARMREGSEHGHVDPSLVTDAIHYVLVMTRKHNLFQVREFVKLDSITNDLQIHTTGVAA